MEKPIAPKKPLKHQAPPLETENIEKVVMIDNKNNIVLLSVQEFEKFNDYEKMMQWEVDELDNFGETIKYSDVLKFKTLLPDIEDFTISERFDADGYYNYTVLEYKKPKNAAQYQKELDIYNNRFNKYEKDLVLYKAKLGVYEDYKKQEKITKLQKELAAAQK